MCVCVYIRKDHIHVCVWLCGIQFCVVFNIFVDIFSQYWRTMTHTTFYVAMVLSMGRRERAPRCGCVPLNPTPTGQVLCVVHELNPRYCVLSMNPAPGTVCCPWIHPQVLHIVHEPSPRYCVLSMNPAPGTVCCPWTQPQVLCVVHDPNPRYSMTLSFIIIVLSSSTLPLHSLIIPSTLTLYGLIIPSTLTLYGVIIPSYLTLYGLIIPSYLSGLIIPSYLTLYGLIIPSRLTLWS